MPLDSGFGHQHSWMRQGTPQEPYKPSVSDPATANSTFWRPTASMHWASTHRMLAWCSKCKPWKGKERDLSQRSGLATKQLKNSQKGRSSNRKQREIRGLTALVPHLQPELAHPMPLSWSVPSKFHIALGWKPPVHYLQMTHLWMRQFQMYRMDLARRSNEQMF